MCFKNRPDIGIRIYNANMKIMFERNPVKRAFLMFMSVPKAIFQSRRKRPAKAGTPADSEAGVP